MLPKSVTAALMVPLVVTLPIMYTIHVSWPWGLGREEINFTNNNTRDIHPLPSPSMICASLSPRGIGPCTSRCMNDWASGSKNAIKVSKELRYCHRAMSPNCCSCDVRDLERGEARERQRDEIIHCSRNISQSTTPLTGSSSSKSGICLSIAIGTELRHD